MSTEDETIAESRCVDVSSTAFDWSNNDRDKIQNETVEIFSVNHLYCIKIQASSFCSQSKGFKAQIFRIKIVNGVKGFSVKNISFNAYTTKKFLPFLRCGLLSPLEIQINRSLFSILI